MYVTVFVLLLEMEARVELSNRCLLYKQLG